MPDLPMRGHFRYLRFKTFPMTPRTPQCEVFSPCCRVLNIRESRRTPNPQLSQVLGFTPTLGQSRGATVMLDQRVVLLDFLPLVKLRNGLSLGDQSYHVCEETENCVTQAFSKSNH